MNTDNVTTSPARRLNGPTDTAWRTFAERWELGGRAFRWLAGIPYASEIERFDNDIRIKLGDQT